MNIKPMILYVETAFRVEHSVAQSSSLCPILVSVFINNMLKNLGLG